MKLLKHFAAINGNDGLLHRLKHLVNYDGHYHSNQLQFQRWLESDDEVEGEYFAASYNAPVPFRPGNKT